MAFTYSGGIITQTGTDTNLSGLSGLTGVTIYDSVYVLDNVFLRVEGTLSFNGYTERMVFVNPDDSGTGLNYMSIYVDDGASLTIACDNGVAFGGFVQTNALLPCIDFGTRAIAGPGGATSYNGGRKFFSVHPSGSIALTGVFVGENSNSQGIISSFDGTSELVDCIMMTKTALSNVQYSFKGTVLIRRTTLLGAVLADRGGTYTFDGFTVGEANEGFLFGGAAVSNAHTTVVDFATYNTSNQDIRINMQGTTNYGTVILVDSQKDAPNTVVVMSDNDGFNFCVWQSNLTLNFLDTDLNATDVKVYAQDVNNGSRFGTIVVSGGTDISDSTKTYEGATASGSISFLPYTAFSRKISGVYTIDNRGNSNGSNITFAFYKYGKLVGNVTPTLVGNGVKTVTSSVLPDANITEANKATVDAYAQIDTSAKLYDRASAYLEDNFGDYTDFVLSRSGALIDVGAYNVTIDATASSAFAISGNTITIKASTFTGNINTTGAFALSNGAVLDGVLNGVLNVNNSDVLTKDIDGTFVVDTDSVTSFTISGFIPTTIQTTGSGTTTILGVENAKLTTTTISGTGTLALGDGLNPSSNWSYSSGTSTLTLSGTEANLLGLRGLAQVDYADAGGKIVYTFSDTTKIVISGTGHLTVDSDVEQMVCGIEPASGQNTLLVQDSGVLQLGKAKNVGGFIIYSSGPALVFANDSSDALFTVGTGWENLKLEEGSRLDWYGGEISTVGLILPGPGSEFRTYSKEAVFVSVPSSLQSTRPEAYIRMQTSDQVINGFVNKFGILLMIGKPTEFNGYEPISSGSAIDMSNQSTSSSYYDFEDLVAGKGSVRDVGGKHNTWVRLLNTNLGSNITVTAQGSTQNDQKYLVESRKGLQFNYIDVDGSAIQNAKVYMSDTDNGVRLSANQVGSNASYTPDRVYAGTSSASGIVDFSSVTDSILLSVYHHNNTSGNAIYDLFDSRGNNNDTSDLFTFNNISYLHGVATTTLELKGTGTLVQEQVLISDFTLTETNKSTVDSYTTLSTATKLYDRAKAELVDSYLGESQTTVTRSGLLVDCRGLNVIIDAMASQAFNLSGNTLTIKSSDFTNNMTTTGIISLVNGAIFSGTRTDANGTILAPRSVSITGLVAGSRLRVYNTTTSTQVVNQVVAGTSYTATYAEGVGYSVGDVLEYRVTKIDKLEFPASVVATSTGWSALVSQDNNPTYAAHGKDGSTVTGISWDSGNMQFDFNETDNVIDGPDIGAWYQYFITTPTGIAEAFGALSWPQVNRITNVASKTAITWDNTKLAPLQINNLWVDRDDGVSIIASGSNSIQINPPAVFVQATGVSGLTPAESAKLDVISDVKATTDQLNFTDLDELIGLATKLDTINEGVQKDSFFIPHTTDL